MKQLILSIFFAVFLSSGVLAQNIVKGIVKDGNSEQPLKGVSINVKESTISKTTNADGTFALQGIPNGKQVVIITALGYETQSFPLNLTGKTADLGEIFLYEDEFSEEQDLSTITITDDELNDDTSAADNISGLLQSSKDVYLRSAAYEWSSSFYRIKGLDSENGKVLINGIEMNKLYNGRPQWSNWGGLNDVFRNQEFSNGLTPSNYTFGGVLGSTNISTRASEYRKGTRISYASSNRSYVHRVMGTYSTGLLKDGWAFTFSGSRRMAEEGFADGTSYNAYSMFGSIEKIFNDKHSLNFTSIFASNRRGKSAPHTQEVYDLKGTKYNEYWGYQDGKIRNSRIKDVEEPILMLNHYWNISDNTTLNTNIAYQFGKIGNSRLDYNAGSNPSPTYYQKLPSYHLARGNTALAYEAQQRFLNNGQVLWNTLYDANATRAINGANAGYILYEDRNDDKQFTANTILNTDINDNITINGKLEYKKLKSENFANVIDLLGGNGYLDIDRFGDIGSPTRQNDVRNPNRIVKEGDRFKYNYNLSSNVLNGFAQAQFKYNKVDFYVAGNVSKTEHQREGLYENGSFLGNRSLGKSPKHSFTNFGAKGGLTYKINGRNLIDINAGYLTKAPSIRNTFSNSRENNDNVIGIDSQKILSGDISYILRTPIVQAKLTGFYTKIQDATNISFYFADGIGGDNTAFLQEILTGIDKKHFGAEIGIEAKVTPTIKLKGAANIGQYTYDNNPNLYVTTEDNEDARNAGFENGFKNFGKSLLKDYKIAAGPQNAYSVGFEYRDPDYWWIGATANYLSNAYINISPLKRSSNLYLNYDGLPLEGYNEAEAKQLLQQEKFDGYTTVNLVGGKSWKIGSYYVGTFASIGNVLNTKYKTGGFENGRNANFNQIKEDTSRTIPLNGSKYWYGRGTTYFLNVYFRF